MSDCESKLYTFVDCFCVLAIALLRHHRERHRIMKALVRGRQKLDERLGEFERRLLAELRQNSRQPALEENRQVIEETTPEIRPDYKEVRDSEAPIAF